MNRILLAQKGEAFPATSHYGGESRFQERRVVELPPIVLGGDSRGCHGGAANTGRMRGAGPARTPAMHRRKFTFRIEPERHAAFCAAAERLGISRQELLTRALDAYLSDRHAPDNAEIHAPRPAQGLFLSAIR